MLENNFFFLLLLFSPFNLLNTYLACLPICPQSVALCLPNPQTSHPLHFPSLSPSRFLTYNLLSLPNKFSDLHQALLGLLDQDVLAQFLWQNCFKGFTLICSPFPCRKRAFTLLLSYGVFMVEYLDDLLLCKQLVQALLDSMSNAAYT